MAISEKLKKILTDAKVDYQVLEHYPVYTALETAQAQHIPGRQLVKAVMVDVGGKLIMCVLSATHKIDFKKLKVLLGGKESRLADEKAIAALFPDYELGAEPPFGASSEMQVYMDRVLEENDSILFNGGTHADVVKMKLKDYVALATPLFADFSEHI